MGTALMPRTAAAILRRRYRCSASQFAPLRHRGGGGGGGGGELLSSIHFSSSAARGGCPDEEPDQQRPWQQQQRQRQPIEATATEEHSEDLNEAATATTATTATAAANAAVRSSPRRVWRSASSSSSSDGAAAAAGPTPTALPTPPSPAATTTSTWTSSVDDRSRGELRTILDRVGEQERASGRMRQNHHGVFRADPAEDMRLMVENFTVPALASALRDREDTLQECAGLLSGGRLAELSDVLRPYEARYVRMRRRRENLLDMRPRGFDDTTILERLRRALMRMPRRVSTAFERRAAVVLPLCNVGGVPAILFEKRARHLRAHPDEVCLPGGMVSVGDDKSIVGTCLREMEEEIGGMPHEDITVLGVLRCNWGEVHHLTGVAVTPVVCYVGEISHLDLRPSADEVAEVFTVPLSSFLNRERWVKRENFAPIFVGGPHVIWGLTGYIVDRFVKDVLARYALELPDEDE